MPEHQSQKIISDAFKKMCGSKTSDLLLFFMAENLMLLALLALNGNPTAVHIPKHLDLPAEIVTNSRAERMSFWESLNVR